MNVSEARDEIKRRWRELWPADKGKGDDAGIICPLCGNGSGASGDGVKQDKRKPGFLLHCFKCGFSGDAITMLEKEIGGGFREAVTEGAKRLSLPMEWNEMQTKKTGGGRVNHPAVDKPPAEDFSAFIEAAREGLKDDRARAYLDGRALSIEKAGRLGVGFVPAWKNPKGGKTVSPRIIIPFSNNAGYLARSIGDEETGAKQNAGAVGLFNVGAFDDAERMTGAGAVFTCEGWADAASCVEVGFPAVALNGAANGALLIEEIERRGFSGAVLIALDNDDAGKKAAEKLKAALDDAGISSAVVDICGGFKDENEFLVSDRDAFYFTCFEAYEAGKAAAKKDARPDCLMKYLTSGGWHNDVEAAKVARMPTGFPSLDEWLGGGLYEGLSVLSGLPSLGKTSLLWQIAETIAAGGCDVLFFSLEMSKAELVSKSLSRHAWRGGRDISADDIQRGREKPTKAEAAPFFQAAARLSVIEGGFNYGVDAIGTYIKAYKKRNGGQLCVFVDYLQAAVDVGKTSEIMAIADAAKSLRQIARENHCPVVCASSMARTNYGEAVGLASFYGSGAIEYSADMAAGLQLQAIGGPEWIEAANEKSAARRDEFRRSLIEKAKAENPCRVAFVGAKNRRGLPSCRINFIFDARHSVFSEDGSGQGAALSSSDVEDLLSI